jgi:threonine aldolase
MHVDLRSDTVTIPSKAMLSAMLSAKVGDDVYGEDPTVRQLEKKLADMFGMDLAMFFPSGTMANQTAIKLHTNPGDQVICDKYSHVYNYEGGAGSFTSGVSFKLINGERGMFDSNQLLGSINPKEFYHSPLSSLVVIENTTNKGGGACWDIVEIKNIKKTCKENNLGLHLDGARIWNALVKKEESPLEYGDIFDTVSVCLSKGLGCPIGSVLLGKKELMKKSIRIRKILGGAMRQSGYLAAAGIFALENNIKRLSDDHLRAKEIGEKLINMSFVKKVQDIETNIIVFEIDKSVNKEVIINAFNKLSILFDWHSMGTNKIRIVTHINYTKEKHIYLLDSLDTLKI